MHGDLESLAQLLGKACDLLRLRAFLPAHLQGIAHDDLLDLMQANGALQAGKVAALVLTLESLESLGGNSQRIRDSEAHAARTVVDGENAAGRGHDWIIGADEKRSGHREIGSSGHRK